MDVISDTEDETGFNHFRYGAAVAASDAPRSNEFGGTHRHQEKFIGWKPFHAKEEDKVSENSESGEFESLKHGVDAGGFVFWNGTKTSSRLEQSTEYCASELEHGDFESNPTSRNLGAENTAFSHDRSGCDSAADIFLLGRELKEDTSSIQTMPVVDPNFGNFASTKSESSGFDFGAGSSANFNWDNTGELSKKGTLDTFSLVDSKEKSLKPNLTTESFGNLDFGLSTGETLNCGKLLNPGVPFVNSFVPRKLKNTFVFGTNSASNSDSKDSVAKSIRQPVKSEICDDFSSIFNRRVWICSNSVDSSFKASDSPSFSSLHDQMEKLNLQNSDDAILFERINQGKEDTRLNSANFFMFGNSNSAPSSFHAELEKLNLQTPVDNINTERGNQAVESAKLNSINPFMSHESVPSSFQNVMEKLNLQSSGDDFASQKRNQDDDNTKHDLLMFCVCPVNPSTEKDNKVEIQRELESDNVRTVFNFTDYLDREFGLKYSEKFVPKSEIEDVACGSSIAATEIEPLASKYQHRKKNKMKVVHEILNPISNFAPMDSSMNILQIPSKSMQPNRARGKKNVSNTGDGTNTSLEVKKEFIISDPGRVAEQEACEKWRLRLQGLVVCKMSSVNTNGLYIVDNFTFIRGNQAYAEGHLLEAEDNRSAARISLGRMRDALNDCMLAIAIDSSFLRAQVRVASKDLQDQKDFVISFEKMQVADRMSQVEELLLKRTSNGLIKALQLISESLVISAHSEKLMAMKAEALMLQRYEEVINFSEQTMGHAEVNALSSGANLQPNKEGIAATQTLPHHCMPLYVSCYALKNLELTTTCITKHEIFDDRLIYSIFDDCDVDNSNPNPSGAAPLFLFFSISPLIEADLSSFPLFLLDSLLRATQRRRGILGVAETDRSWIVEEGNPSRLRLLSSLRPRSPPNSSSFFQRRRPRDFFQRRLFCCSRLLPAASRAQRLLLLLATSSSGVSSAARDFFQRRLGHSGDIFFFFFLLHLATLPNLFISCSDSFTAGAVPISASFPDTATLSLVQCRRRFLF
ncbi:hypothetical protein ZIOFF_022696 [Zingiber officinale]|uniref:Uncharacterized protein n=1 Tax=Zingiber officinale TaxID=94328 RepID=A0A8J5H3D4_ZINOF|nr:hypothetical protein ZIOFF_022696 [Zingiber officinale]